MKTLQISQPDALRVYENASTKEKKTLKKQFGKQIFIGDITDKVKSFKDACKVLGMDAVLPDVSVIPKEDQKAIIDYYKVIIIARALNGDWTADWEDSSQKKWYPWFKMKSGFGLSDTAYDFTRTGAHVGSRLCFKTEKLALYAGTKFEKYYKNFLTI